MTHKFKFSTDIPLQFDIGITDWKYKHKSPFEAYIEFATEHFSQFSEVDLERLDKDLQSQWKEGFAEQLVTIQEVKGRIIIAGEGQL